MVPLFDPTVTLGNILTLFGMVGAIWLAAWRTYVGLIRRTDQIEATMRSYDASALAAGQRQEWVMRRLEKHDDIIVALAGDVREMMGRQRTGPS